jgi:glucan 1,3-beta-glucosidase
MAPREPPRRKPRERSTNEEERRPRNHNPNRIPRAEAPSSRTSSQALSADSLAKLNLLNEKASREQTLRAKRTRTRPRDVIDEKSLISERPRREHKRRRRRRVVSGALLEDGEGKRLQGIRGGEPYDEEGMSKQKKRICKL